MDRPLEGPPPGVWSRRDTRTLAAIVAGACASLFWLVHPWYDVTPPGTADASIYILCAKSLVAGEGYTYLGMPFTVRPPGFSALIAPLIAWRGVDFQAFNVLVSLFGVALVALLFAWARPRIGTWPAAAVAVLVWMNPAMRAMCNHTMSDVPGTACLLGCLLLERRARRSPSIGKEVVCGLAIGLSAYVRTVTVLMVPAILLSALIRRRRQGLVAAAIPLLLLAPWSLRNARSHPPWPADQTALASYSAAMWHADGGDPGSPRVAVGDVLARIPLGVGESLSALGRRLEPGRIQPLHVAAGAAVLACVVAILVRRRSPPEIFAALGLLQLAVYPSFDERLAFPIALVGVVACAEVFLLPLARPAGGTIARAACCALVLALLAFDFDPRPRWKEIEADHRARTELASAWRASLPPAARVASNIGWHWSVLLDRPVYSLFFAALRARTVAGAEAVIDKYRIDTVILRADPPDDPVFLGYFANRYGRPVIAGRGVVFQVR